MGRKRTSVFLNLFMNGEKVGTLTRMSSGVLELVYADEWMASERGRSLSLSMPVIQKRHRGEVVANYFDNLLPDSLSIRNRIQARFGIPGSDSFDLLSYIGRDCVGALQLLPEGSAAPDVRHIHAQRLSGKEIAGILRNYQTLPLGMDRDGDFRISLAGAQEKTALLYMKGKWLRPEGATPTSHILKLPIGRIDHASIDLSESVENEWLCHLLLKEFGVETARMEIHTFDGQKVLAVERFDRRWADDGTWLMRLPQEDFCQAMGLPPALKYESDGGPGIGNIMEILLGSSRMREDRRAFMRVVFVFWLLGAIDGHAKNFSISLNPKGAYRLTPVYDVLSAYPLLAQKQLQSRKVKMAMAVTGQSKHYEWSKIGIRHWMNTARLCKLPIKEMDEIIENTISMIDQVIDTVAGKLPRHFPEHISGPIFEYLRGMKKRCE